MKKYRESFAASELGHIHALLPLNEMADELASHFPKKNPQGNTPMFAPEGEVALMFLKPYTGLSDDGLVEMLNGSVHMQMFCGVLIDPSHPIKDGKIVSAIRNRLAFRLDIVRQQSVLYKKWDSQLKDKDLCMSDATCYESHLRYPTDIKLMWECCEWLYALLHMICQEGVCRGLFHVYFLDVVALTHDVESGGEAFKFSGRHVAEHCHILDSPPPRGITRDHQRLKKENSLNLSELTSGERGIRTPAKRNNE